MILLTPASLTNQTLSATVPLLIATLTVPTDGPYDLQILLSGLTNAAGQVSVSIKRQTSGSSDLGVVISNPLDAKDALNLTVYEASFPPIEAVAGQKLLVYVMSSLAEASGVATTVNWWYAAAYTGADNRSLVSTDAQDLSTTFKVYADLKAIMGTALTETAGYLAAAFKRWFNVAAPTGTVNSIPDAVAGADNGLALKGSDMNASKIGGKTLDVSAIAGNLAINSYLGNSVGFTTQQTADVGTRIPQVISMAQLGGTGAWYVKGLTSSGLLQASQADVLSVVTPKLVVVRQV